MTVNRKKKSAFYICRIYIFCKQFSQLSTKNTFDLWAQLRWQIRRGGVAVTDNFSYISYSTNFESKAKVN